MLPVSIILSSVSNVAIIDAKVELHEITAKGIAIPPVPVARALESAQLNIETPRPAAFNASTVLSS